MFQKKVTFFVLGVALISLLETGARAQENVPPPETTAEGTVTVESIAAMRALAEETKDLDASTRAQVLEIYDDALAQIRAADEWRAKTAEFDRLREAVPATLAEIEAQLAAPLPEPPNELPETVADMEALLRDAESAQKAAQAAFDEVAQELPRRAERRRTIPDLVIAAQSRRQEIQANLNTPGSGAENAYVGEAQKTLARARLQTVQAELKSYAQELASYEARGSLLTRRQELAKRTLSIAQKRFKAYQGATIEVRKAEAVAAMERARSALLAIGDQNPAIRVRAAALAERNAQLADFRTGAEGLVSKITVTLANLEERRAQNKKITDDMDRIVQRVNAAGLDEVVGVMLRRAKAELPDVSVIKSRIVDRKDEVVRQEIQRINLSEERLDLSDAALDVNSYIDSLSSRYSEAQRQEFVQALQTFFQDQRGLLDAAYIDTERYLDLLFDLNTEERQLLATTEVFTEYINKNILWIGGTDILNPEDFAQVIPALKWAANPSEWINTFPLLKRDVQKRWYAYFLGIMLITILMASRRRVKRQIYALGAIASKRRHTDYSQTLYTFFCTIVLALGFPVCFGATAWLLGGALQRLPVARAFAGGLWGVAFFLLLVEFVRAITIREGLAEAHFSWPRERIKPARRWLSLLEAGGLPFVFCSAFFTAQSNEAWQDGLGRVGLIAGLVAGACVGFMLVKVLYRPMDSVRRQSWPGDYGWTRFPLYILTAVIPMVLAVLAVGGYFYTATQLSSLLYLTNWLLILVLLMAGMARRWFLVTRRLVAVEQARKRRAAAKASEDSDAPEVDASEEAVDLVRVDAQTQRLIWSVAVTVLLVGCWFIWRSYVPALTNLDFEIYSISETYTVTADNEAGVPVDVTRTRQVPFRFSHFFLLGIVILGTVVTVRNLPGFLELLLLKRLAMGAGERYAVLSIIKYVIVGIGISIAFSVVGIGWSNLQWLIAALSLGLGFGLQEIFANFVSGVIILFERPVRLGDTVTVGQISGVVTRIRIRATTITDFERKELIVPNKEFITGQLVNWSLTDPILRVRVPVGIAYGSDTDKARRTLMKVARGLPAVLKDPAPQVLFLQFGESTLNFELRVFSPDVENFMLITDAAHTRIDKAFREAGIDIAIPQRDLHIRSGLDSVIEAIHRDAVKNTPGPKE